MQQPCRSGTVVPLEWVQEVTFQGAWGLQVRCDWDSQRDCFPPPLSTRPGRPGVAGPAFTLRSKLTEELRSHCPDRPEPPTPQHQPALSKTRTVEGFLSFQSKGDELRLGGDSASKPGIVFLVPSQKAWKWDQRKPSAAWRGLRGLRCFSAALWGVDLSSREDRREDSARGLREGLQRSESQSPITGHGGVEGAKIPFRFQTCVDGNAGPLTGAGNTSGFTEWKRSCSFHHWIRFLLY